MNTTLKFLCAIISAVILFNSCVKEPLEPDKIIPDKIIKTKGLLVLNEGLFNMNNSTLTYYDFADSTARTDYFELKNGRKLGDTGIDMAKYGSKVYIVVNNSSQLEVIDFNTGISVKQIPFFNGSKPRQPRFLAFNKNKAFLCLFDGTVAVIDTATLEAEKYISVGRNPDGIAIANNKVYVSNSGGLDFPNYDKTVSVIDIETLTEVKKIEVSPNPFIIVPDKYGDLYVISRGNYDNIKMCLQVIDSKTDEIKHTFPDLEILNLAIHGDTAYAYHYDFMSDNGSKIIMINVKNETVISNNFISDGTVIETIYSVAVDKYYGDVFLTDARGFVNTGKVICFSREGKKKYSFEAGLNPGHIVFF